MREKFLILLASLALLAFPSLKLRAEDERAVLPGMVDAVWLFSQGEYKDASRLFARLLQRQPDNGALNYYMALCDVALYKVNEGVSRMEKAVALDSSNTWYRHRLAQLYGATKSYEKALAQYERLEKERPKDPYLADEIGEIYLRAGHYDKYYPIAKSYVTGEGLDEEDKLKYLSGLLKDFSREEVKAMRPWLDSLYVNLDKSHPGSPAPMDNWCQILAWLGDWEQLDVYAAEAVSRFQQDTTLCYYGTAAKYFRKDYKGSAALLEKLITLQKGDRKKVLSHYSWLGEIYFKGEMWQKCFDTYDKALRLDPDNILILNNYAYFLSLRKRNLKKALQMSRKTVEAEPDNATYLDTCGWILYLLGRLEEAKAQFNHAKLYGGNDNAVILDHYATVLYDLGEYRLAHSYWTKALTKNENQEVEGLEEKIEKAAKAIAAGNAKQ